MRLIKGNYLKENSLIIACRNSLSDIVEILCNQKDINFNAVWRKKTAVHYACKNSDIDSLKHLLARDDLEVNKIEDREISYFNRYDKTREYLHSPLSEACFNGRLEIVKMLKDDGRANFNELIACYVFEDDEFNEFYSVFSLACFSKNKELVEYLLSFSDSDRNYKEILTSLASTEYYDGLQEITKLVLDHVENFNELVCVF